MVAVDAVSFTLLQDQLQSVLETLSEREAGVVRLRLASPTASRAPSTRSVRCTA